MVGITDKIIRVLESDASINTKNINLVLKSKRLFGLKNVLNVYGVAGSAQEKEKIVEIANTEAGNNYEVVDRLIVI